MIRIRFFKVHQDRVERLVSWGEELAARREEVLATFDQETMQREAAFLIATTSGPVMVYVMEAEDLVHRLRNT
ncbi:DUF6176 family protein [Candidatus Aeolococcus gillhamiae]|uniref:DUF6176 family protein n=1 Tax=Candidatus Aeolococcus gillhamiae TaxID=3127015 RepID=UPI0033130339